MDNFTVYMHINRINGKKYIGITSQPPKGRWRNGKGYYDCMESAKNSLGIKSTSHISRCCAGKRGKAYGSMWSFSKEKKEPYVRLWKGGIVHG